MTQSQFQSNYCDVEDRSISLDTIKSQKRKLSTLRGSSLEEQMAAMFGHNARYSPSNPEIEIDGKVFVEASTDRTLDSVEENISDWKHQQSNGILKSYLELGYSPEFIEMQKAAYMKAQANANKNKSTFE